MHYLQKRLGWYQTLHHYRQNKVISNQPIYNAVTFKAFQFIFLYLESSIQNFKSIHVSKQRKKGRKVPNEFIS